MRVVRNPGCPISIHDSNPSLRLCVSAVQNLGPGPSPEAFVEHWDEGEEGEEGEGEDDLGCQDAVERAIAAGVEQTAEAGADAREHEAGRDDAEKGCNHE